PTAYFAALAPDGAAVALRLTADEAADRMRLTPDDLIASGFADGAVPDAGDPDFDAVVGAVVAGMRAEDETARLERRAARWSAPVPRTLS
ncbi:MAG: acetyl-CoA carboxylase subunit alpha/beta, partial [Frankia sp.]|nr:acetyl-CoA carboxylase subunit alpha/beta [Frankia sp.]